MHCNICQLVSVKHVRIGTITICEECLTSINRLYNNQEQTHNYDEFEILFHAEMTLRIFKITYPETSKLDSFPFQLKRLRRNIENLEIKLAQLPSDANLHAPMKEIVKELKDLYESYC